MECTICGKHLDNGLDTFGEIGLEMCWPCWSELGDEATETESWYGLGPHHHQYTHEGQIVIGSTTLDPLPPKNEDGSYTIGNLRFSPDPDAPGLGIWSR
jgi:hypothetical protein